MSTGDYKKKTVTMNDNVGNDDNNTPKVNTTTFQYDETLTRGKNVVNRVATAPQTFEARIREEQARRAQYKEDFKEFKESGGSARDFEREFGSLLTYKGATSIVDKKPKKRGTPK